MQRILEWISFNKNEHSMNHKFSLNHKQNRAAILHFAYNLCNSNKVYTSRLYA